MSYSDFTPDKAVNQLFLKHIEEVNLFLKVEEVNVSSFLTEVLQGSVPVALANDNAKARSEFIVAPIFVEMYRSSVTRFSLFSGVEFTVDLKEGLCGEFDFIISKSSQNLFIQAPVTLMIKTLNGNLVSGFGECVAGMEAARRFNINKAKTTPFIYGVVTSGDVWRFLRLDGKTLQIDTEHYYLPDLGKILGILLTIIDTEIIKSA